MLNQVSLFNEGDSKMSDVPQLDAFAKVLGLFENRVFGSTGDTSSTEFYSVPHPGIFINPNLKHGSNTNDMLIISEIFNQCFDATWLYRENVNTVDSVYKSILERTALPKSELPTGMTESKLEAMERQLSGWRANYKTYEERYNEARRELLAAREQGKPGSVISALRAKRYEAEKDWEVYGNKYQYDKLDANLSYYRALTPRIYFEELKRQLADSEAEAPTSPYYETFIEPPISQWNSPNTSWAFFTEKFKFSDITRRTKHKSWSGGVSASFGFWSAKGGAAGSENREYLKTKNVDIDLSFELLRVRIIRPWLEQSLLAERFWAPHKNWGWFDVSTGFNPYTSEPVGPQGKMPVLPTHAVVARNVSLTANWSDKERTFIKKVVSGKAKGGWGPFRASGSYRKETTSEDVTSVIAGNTLRIEHPQIIGLMGTLLPQSPNPNPLLNWEDDIAPRPGATPPEEIEGDEGPLAIENLKEKYWDKFAAQLEASKLEI